MIHKEEIPVVNKKVQKFNLEETQVEVAVGGGQCSGKEALLCLLSATGKPGPLQAGGAVPLTRLPHQSQKVASWRLWWPQLQQQAASPFWVSRGGAFSPPCRGW